MKLFNMPFIRFTSDIADKIKGGNLRMRERGHVFNGFVVNEFNCLSFTPFAYPIRILRVTE